MARKSLESKKIISIDCGKRNMKAKCGDKELIYRNKYNLRHSDETLNGDKTWNVTYEGVEYTVGNNASRSDAKEGKASDSHILCALTVITQFLNPEDKNNDIVVMYGESVDKYFDAKNKANIKKRLEGRHEITVGEDHYEFTITYVHILPEGVGHVLQDLPKYMGTQYVVDIGGKTINFLTLENGRPIEEESASMGKGIMNIEAKVWKAIKNSSIGEMPERVVSQYIREGSSSPEVNQIISNCIYDQFDEFDSFLEMRNIYIHDICETHGVTFIGGGTELFKHEIENAYRRANMIKEPVMANVRGFYNYGVAKFSDKE